MKSAPKSSGIKIREAEPRDAECIARLCGQLGYPSTAEEVASRHAGMAASPEHAVFVADLNQGGVASLAGIFVTRSIEAAPRRELAALVVDEAQRSQSIGRALLDHAECWACARGCSSIALRSNVLRERAHAFYLRASYTHSKTQKAFRKELWVLRPGERPASSAACYF
jgi:GNAT superfamily N-acetyltransferase